MDTPLGDIQAQRKYWRNILDLSSGRAFLRYTLTIAAHRQSGNLSVRLVTDPRGNPPVRRACRFDRAIHETPWPHRWVLAHSRSFRAPDHPLFIIETAPERRDGPAQALHRTERHDIDAARRRPASGATVSRSFARRSPSFLRRLRIREKPVAAWQCGVRLFLAT